MKLLEFTKTFDSEEACEAYLKDVREKEGLKCSKCGCEKLYWNKARKIWICAECHHEIRLTAGTVMHASKLPLMYWFTAIHLLTSTKKTFSALEIQRQLGHKRYQPIWEMVHKIRSVMGERDAEYKLEQTIELDEGYFSTDDKREEGESLKRGVGSQKKSKVLVMVESEAADNPKKGQKSRKCGHLKMKVIPNLLPDTFAKETIASIDSQSTVIMDNLKSHKGVEEHVAESQRQTVPGKEAPKILPWVHIAISNVKSLMQDMYHGIKEEFLQEYLDEFCYKFNRKYFGDKVFDRLIIASIKYRPTFSHHAYQKCADCG